MQTRTIRIIVPAEADVPRLVKAMTVALEGAEVEGARLVVGNPQPGEDFSPKMGPPRDALAEPHCHLCGGSGVVPLEAGPGHNRCLACDGTGEVRG